MPNDMHFPIRNFTSESQRGLSAAVAGVSVDLYRAWWLARCGRTKEGRKSAERSMSVRMLQV